ncbi:hypothetical protein HPP92_012776 [Vanilla planifolia]|uniref:protein-serine/threonine phosphatase n=1 Tax=Vanilla planifolia TaxID=51239 RepID=A0A835QTA5_VANPL|nr:hypothetical protein HPP92_012776 [Vanilla planifolia]
MVAGAEFIHQSISVLDVQYRCISKGMEEIAEPVSVDVGSASEVELRASDATSTISEEVVLTQFVPRLRSGSYADIGGRRDMEDEHIQVDNLSAHLGPGFTFPSPSAFYGVFDGHAGPDVAAYMKRHAIELFFENAEFPHASQADGVFIDSVENSVRRSFLLADLAIADDCPVSIYSGTTALTALIFGRVLLVANAGDCRAVLCRKGKALDMSQDHRPIYAAELQRVVECGGYVDNCGYLNGLLSVSRALGDWEIKLPRGSRSPLIAEPEFRQTMLTEDDEFLIIGCDGIWDVMSSQRAVSMVRMGLRRHDDPERCAKELVMEALRLEASDNLTVIVVCFDTEYRDSTSQLDPCRPSRLRGCSLSMEALCSLRSLLMKDDVMN